MRILCFAGFSAVGKRTTIQRILDGDAELCRRFGVSGTLYATGYAFGPFCRERCAAADTVLVQWQVAEHAKLCTLREWFPRAEHRTYFLLRDWDAHLAAHQRKYGHAWAASVADVHRRTLSILRDHFSDGPVEIVSLPEISHVDTERG